MRHPSLPMSLLALLFITDNLAAAYARPSWLEWTKQRYGWVVGQLSSPSRFQAISKRQLNTNPNGSTFLWLQQDEYSGQTFFDRWDFYDQSDPTNGHVTFLNKSAAFSNGLAYVDPNGTVIMKGDDTTTLAQGVYRNSVRISSQAVYNTGLFILDLNRAPWGCGMLGVWPAFWTVGANWPNLGEIDIIEGVHDNEHNQVTWHTRDGCNLTTPTNYYTGSIVSPNAQNQSDCNALLNNNAGCAITEWSRASYGPYFDAQGGGVFAMKWDENGIAVWSFYRAAVPQDITDGIPDTANWGSPVAELWPQGCDPLQYFANHSIVFDITFCGDWAGNSYATSGCPGTCDERLMDPANFVNASFSINSLKVYRKQPFSGQTSAGTSLSMIPIQIMILLLAAVLNVLIL
ncbi:glycoside hydrolase family 16 protein [Amanita muscaria Koide BX008]|uniref:Glycoside hydrolase family 16 protein n=1 Tax=Amanita muscaria (strain Koide BX008) TaxID=946122 RepID=A0A0C2XML0_AMAMK|nr:glycoside hydrolase family 16 protein [Amanita muscaria Koide BX008]